MSAVRLLAISGLLPALALPALADQVTLTPSKDATIYSDLLGDIANGSGQYIFAGNNGSGEPRRALIQFSLLGIPAGSTITGVTLTTTLTRVAPSFTPAHPVSLHRLSRAWNEGPSDPDMEEGGGAVAMNGDSTWVHTFYDTTLWTVRGGDFVSSPSFTLGIPNEPAPPRECTFGPSAAMAADVQAWLNAPASNFGWIMVGNEADPGTARQFRSRQSADPAAWPRLTVTYTPPATGCYANCDGSTTAPALNVQDFTCFLQKFAAQDPYANCDASTTAPALNVQDFTCFLQKFAAGCSAP